ncbi:hypothetical protein NMG29_16310 [Streptomyces cocklensis]|jgi:hypothetical protein|nr:hypothetical protein [Actinacidiphila cocklensis]MDD1059754.1 hypothetical protein [Actinacidiphila cocklensis]WSX72625.1 hypothetical protein OH826_01320 [Streptomyces sp. NBC_00899]WSX81306.1 hypothetical protein OH826_50175 [Streptomyces sp. NBC_00899]
MRGLIARRMVLKAQEPESYRSSMRCGICGSERLSPVGKLVSGVQVKDRLRLRFARPGIFRRRQTVEADIARACLDCGALYPFLSAFDRQRLGAIVDGLTDV